MAYMIEPARKMRGWTQAELAERSGITQQSIARYENGSREPKVSAIVKLADALGVTISYLLGLDDDPGYVAAAPTEAVAVPVLGRIAAGTPREAFGQSGETHDTAASLVADHPRAFWLVVAGHSMDRLFPEGSLVLVDPEDEVRDGDVAAVFVNGDDATVKRVLFEGDSVRLHPESHDPEYRDRVIDRSDPDAPAFRVVGRVVSYTAPDRWRA